MPGGRLRLHRVHRKERGPAYFEGSSSNTLWFCPGLPAFSDSGVTITTLPGRTALATAARNPVGASKRFSSSGPTSIEPPAPEYWSLIQCLPVLSQDLST